MKKTMIILAAMITLLACNSEASTEAPKVDSTVKVDSVAAPAADTTVAQEAK